MSYQNEEDSPLQKIVQRNGIGSKEKRNGIVTFWLLTWGVTLGMLLFFGVSFKAAKISEHKSITSLSQAVKVGSFNVSFENPYYGVPPSQSMLPWDFLVEPHRLQTARVEDIDTAVYTVEWTMNNDTYSGAEVSLTFTSVGVQKGSVMITDTTSGMATTSEFTIAVKYIRREIRSLSEEDRLTYFGTLRMLYEINQTLGEQLYGSKYRR